jgi:hypothetical protein
MPKSAAYLLVMRRCESLSSFGAASLEHQASVFSSHTRAKAVRFGAAPVVRLKSPFRHSDEFSSKNENPKTNRGLSLCQETGRSFLIATLRFCGILEDRRKLPKRGKAAKKGQAGFVPKRYCENDRSPIGFHSLFYYSASLDRSESSVLVSARLERCHPVNN